MYNLTIYNTQKDKSTIYSCDFQLQTYTSSAVKLNIQRHNKTRTMSRSTSWRAKTIHSNEKDKAKWHKKTHNYHCDVFNSNIHYHKYTTYAIQWMWSDFPNGVKLLHLFHFNWNRITVREMANRAIYTHFWKGLRIFIFAYVISWAHFKGWQFWFRFLYSHLSVWERERVWERQTEPKPRLLTINFVDYCM